MKNNNNNINPDKLEACRHWVMDQAWDTLAREKGIDRQRYTMESAPTPLYVHAMFAQQYAQKLAVTTAKSTSHCMHVQPKHTTRVAHTSAGKKKQQERAEHLDAERWLSTPGSVAGRPCRVISLG